MQITRTHLTLTNMSPYTYFSQREAYFSRYELDHFLTFTIGKISFLQVLFQYCHSFVQ